MGGGGRDRSEALNHGIVVDQVGYRYLSRDGQVAALDSVTLSIGPTDFVCCVGPSGCGKTTLLHLIAGFMRPTSGSITMDSRVVDGPDARRAVVFQQPTLYPWMTVADNVGFGPMVRGVPRRERASLIEQYLSLVGLSSAAKMYPYQLSGGMQQRVAIARVLANDPEFLLMDEPFGALDALTREHMQEELLRIWKQQQKGVFFITHSAEEAVYLGTRVIVMSRGPGRILFEKDVAFSSIQGRESRAIRSSPDFIAAREEVMSLIYEL